MRAIIYKRKHMFTPWMLVWRINGNEYHDSFETLNDAKDYADAMDFDFVIDRQTK